MEDVRLTGTELESGADFGIGIDFVSVAPGRVPPDRKEGQRERSSGRDDPPEAFGERCDRMAAA